MLTLSMDQEVSMVVPSMDQGLFHVALRQELGLTQQEMKRVQAHIENMHSESDMKARGMVEKIGKMEAKIQTGEMMKKELHQVHLEAQSLIAARQNLTAEIQFASEELQRANADVKKLPEMHGELDALKQEHQKLRAAFEYEKGLNMDQVDRMKATEKNLITLARELEKLQADVASAEKKTSAPNPYVAAYSSPDPVYPSAGQGSSYTDRGYNQSSGYDAGYARAGGYADTGYSQGGASGYSNAYGRPQAQMTAGAVADGMHSYGGIGDAGYPDGYGRLQGQGPASGEGMNPYGANSVGPYDGAGGAALPARR